MSARTKPMCEDCGERPPVVVRIADDSLPIDLCAECDPGAGCRPIVTDFRYSNGKQGFQARCPQCGWIAVGSAESPSAPRAEAKRHAEAWGAK